ncbi:MAG TPA: phosphoribosylanthranilate isomerase [Steroidobacteraceae bacterium]|nr:phosphoribosylanthranilate isomerase [Steroidobacteraceae bacterium]
MWIKICGLTDAAAVSAALEAGADAMGWVFAASARRMQPAQAAVLAERARGRCALVAVTLHPSQSLVDEILQVLRPDYLQSDLEDLAVLRLPQQLQRLPVVRDIAQPAASAPGEARAARAAGAAGAAGAASAPSELPPRLLFEGARSGSNQLADWSTAARLAARTQLILAGGLNAQNVAAAIHHVRPFGVDVSSGVESAPGRKSPALIAEFVAAARAAAEVPA